MNITIPTTTEAEIEADRGVVIPEDQLIPGQFYAGVGRFVRDIALWDGKKFHGYTYEWGKCAPTTAVYGALGFDPVTRIIHDR